MLTPKNWSVYVKFFLLAFPNYFFTHAGLYRLGTEALVSSACSANFWLCVNTVSELYVLICGIGFVMLR